MYSGRANAIAKELVLPRIYPDEGPIQAEWRHGGSRFDFLVGRRLVEVKAVSLVEVAANAGGVVRLVNDRVPVDLSETEAGDGIAVIVWSDGPGFFALVESLGQGGAQGATRDRPGVASRHEIVGYPDGPAAFAETVSQVCRVPVEVVSEGFLLHFRRDPLGRQDFLDELFRARNRL